MTENTSSAGQSAAQPSKTYRYSIKYYIVDSFGGIVWSGSLTITENLPTPSDEAEAAVFHLTRTIPTIRQSCDSIGAPAGRVLIAATLPA